MTTATENPPCPKCGGPMFDEKNGKFPWKPGRPIFKCRNKGNCDGVIWEPKQNGAPAKPSTEKKPFNTGPYVPAIDGDENPYAQGTGATQSDSQGMTKGTAVAMQYEATLVWVLKHVTPKLTAADIPVDGAAVNSMVATILIQASK